MDLETMDGFNYSLLLCPSHGLCPHFTHTHSSHLQVWSKRINLYPNATVKAEVSLRPRKVGGCQGRVKGLSKVNCTQ